MRREVPYLFRSCASEYKGQVGRGINKIKKIEKDKGKYPLSILNRTKENKK